MLLDLAIRFTRPFVFGILTRGAAWRAKYKTHVQPANISDSKIEFARVLEPFLTTWSEHTGLYVSSRIYGRGQVTMGVTQKTRNFQTLAFIGQFIVSFGLVCVSVTKVYLLFKYLYHCQVEYMGEDR